MAEIKNVTGTAFFVAEYRAEENSAPDPLYRDSIVELFLNDATRQAAASAAIASPSVKEGVKLRTRYFDDTLEERIARGCRQVVIDESTGDAGFEHFARLGAPWITGIDDVYALGDELGLDVIQNVLSADLHRWHRPTRPMSSSFLRFYSLCTLATKSESARSTQSRSPRVIST